MPARTDRRTLGLTLREHIGGRWAISLLAYAINAPLSIVLTVINASASQQGISVGALLLLSVLGYIGFGVVALVANVSVFRDRRAHPRPVAWVVLLGALAGLARGLIIGLGADLLSADAAAFTASRVITSTILGAVLVPTLALLLSIIDSYRTQRASLVADAARLHVDVMRAAGESDAIRATLLASVREDLEDIARTGDAQKARDLGRRMWVDESTQTLPHLSWRDVVGQSMTRNPFPTGPVVLVWSLSAIGTLAAAIGLLPALEQVCVSVAAIAVLFVLGRRWTAAGGGALAFVVVMLAAVVLTGPVASILFDDRPWPTGAGLIVANTIWLPLLTLLIAIVMTAVRESEEVLASLAAEVDESAVAVIAARDETQRLRRELATQMHGTVHSRLLAATAIASEVTLQDAAAEALEASIGEAMLHGEDDARPLSERVDEVVSTWSALLAVTLAVDSCAAHESGRRAERAARVVEEALANAFRHGRATAASVAISRRDEVLEICIDDDGQGLPHNTTRGMGSALFDAVSAGAWSRSPRLQGGTRLLIDIP